MRVFVIASDEGTKQSRIFIPLFMRIYSIWIALCLGYRNDKEFYDFLANK